MSRPPDAGEGRADVAVVGGGLAGLVAALLIRKAGVEVVLVAPPRPPDRRTTAFLGESVEILRRTGAFEPIAAEAQPLRAVRIIDATRRLIRAPEVRFDAADMGLPVFGYNVPNQPLLGALDDAVAGAAIRRVRAAASDVAPGDDSVAIAAANGERIRARLVVAADGRGSLARAAAGIGVVTGPSTGQAALVCDLRHDRGHDDVSTEFHTESGPLTFVPLRRDRSGLVWVTTEAEADRLRRLPADRLAERIEMASRSVFGRILLEGEAQTFPLGSAIAERLGANRIALVGEAAHVLPPIAAQGFNLTLRDVAVLAELVAGHAADPGAADLLADYDRRRRPDIAARAQAVEYLNRSLLSDFLPVQGVRGLGLMALGRVPALRRALMRLGLGLS